MKKFIFILFLLFFINQVQAVDYGWQNLDKSCFSQSGTIADPVIGSIKVLATPEQTVFFVQDNALLVSKNFTTAKQQYLDYEVLDYSGFDQSGGLKYLTDGNLQTKISFSPFSSLVREIKIKSNKPLNTGNFIFRLHFQGEYLPRYFISQDDQKFIEVKDVNKFDWQYLKIKFENYSKNTTAVNNLSIQELSLISFGKDTLLVNSLSKNSINIYTDYQCQQDDVFQKVLSQLFKNSLVANFKIDVNTKIYTPVISDNPDYNSDFDSDNILNSQDNCPFASNENQLDVDGDLVGDVCDYDNETKNFYDQDSDLDGVGNSLDNCPYVYNPTQLDSNADWLGDLCVDDDQDGYLGYKDNCKDIYNPDQKDINVNGVGDACEFDKDKDGVFDSIDNCINIVNASQDDQDKDEIGDLCDNCNLYNPDQLDKDQSNVGDKCEQIEQEKINNDKDKDGILDFKDNCCEVANADQLDRDKDRVGDACDNCPDLQNNDQQDLNKNNTGDLCEDVDSDGLLGYLDNCPTIANAKQSDLDNDSVGDDCEDSDGDSVLALQDNCPFDYNKDQRDVDNDKIGDKCDKKDDRLVESNKTLFVSFIVLIVLVFGGLIWMMVRKMKMVENNK